MGLEPEDRKRLLLVGDVEGGLAKLYSQVGWGSPPKKKIPRNFSKKKCSSTKQPKPIFDSKS